MRQLDLLIPGLLGPVPDVEAAAALLPDMPALARWLARADAMASEPSEMERELCIAGFGLSPDAHVGLAALARHGEEPVPSENRAPAWIRLDPLHLRVDMTHARAFGAPMLALTREEADALVATINGHLDAEGITVEAPVPDRWYVALAEVPDLITHTPSEVAGRNIDHFLPRGKEGPYWRRLMNELQMLLYDHPVNVARRAQGQLPVNSVWPWGAGALPPMPPSRPPPARVLADEPIARGLANLSGSKVAALPDRLDETAVAATGRTLLVDTGIRDPLVHGEAEGWLAGLADVEARWLAPALECLRAATLDRLVLHTASSRIYPLSRR